MTGLIIAALMGFFFLHPVDALADSVVQKEMPPEPTYQTYKVSMTGYNAVPSQTDGNPHITASGAYTYADVVAARSSDLADELPFGTVIEIATTSAPTSKSCGISAVRELLGYRVIADAMHPRKRNQIDLLFNTGKIIKAKGTKVNPAVALGVCKNIEIRVVGYIDIDNIPHTQAELKLAVAEIKGVAAKALAINVSQ